MESFSSSGIRQNIIFRSLLFTLTVIIVDFYYFPTTFLFFPIGNTKLFLAVIGLLVVGLGLRNQRHGVVGNSLFTLSVLASMVSLISLFAMTINHTPDDTYVSYIISVYVWLSAAYVVISWVRFAYGAAPIYRICNFIIWVCAIQCVIALLVVHNQTVQLFVDSITDTVWLRNVDRIYGIGCSLDTAGIHFSLALIMISYILGSKSNEMRYNRIFLYILAFIIITIVGNMIARVTIVGVILSAIYLLYKSEIYKGQIAINQRKVWMIGLVSLVVAVPIVAYYYTSNDVFYKNIRFGFEGFFSLAEKGEWDVASNNTLKSMIVFPETTKTWLLGDGYIVNPKNDPFYTGPITHGYYMNTDIGYLRFIFYFGLPGLLIFSIFLGYVTKVCNAKHQRYKQLFLLFLLANFVIWLKVATDVFFIFAIFLLADKDEEVEYEIQPTFIELNQ